MPLSKISPDALPNPIHSSAVDKPKTVNTIVTLQRIIAEILAKLNELSDRNNHQEKEIKDKFHQFTYEAAASMRKEGSVGFFAALVSTGLFASSFFMPKKSLEKAILGALSQQASPLSGIMSSKYRADSSIASNKASLKLQSYTNSSGKSQQYQDLTRSLQETLQAANQAQLTASRQG